MLAVAVNADSLEYLPVLCQKLDGPRRKLLLPGRGHRPIHWKQLISPDFMSDTCEGYCRDE